MKRMMEIESARYTSEEANHHMLSQELRIGTRGSQLALHQANWVKEKLAQAYPNLKVSLIRIKTAGDKIQDAPLAKIGGKGLFVKEIEEALIQRRIDLAVHSIKDVPTELPKGLHLSAITRREDPRDVLISRNGIALKALPQKARIGTSSLRRQAQLLHFRDDLDLIPLRGNLDTRLKKLKTLNLDGIILAYAGVKRLGLEEKITEIIPTDISLPAIGQGALGIETRMDDEEVEEKIRFLNDPTSAIAVSAERAFLRRLGGGCQVPIAAFGQISGSTLRLDGMVGTIDGKRLIRHHMEEPIEEAEKLGIELADILLNKGAKEILKEIYQKSGSTIPVLFPPRGEGGLRGKRILITRARSQSSEFATRLRKFGAEVIEFPTIEILPPSRWEGLDRAIHELKSYDWVIFTSANGVHFFWQRLKAKRKNLSLFSSLKVAAIGPATAKKLKEKGIQVAYTPKEFVAEGMLKEFEKVELKGKRILLARAKKARDILPKGLRKMGAKVDVVEAYRTVKPKGGVKRLKEILVKKKIDAITFTSSSTVNHFVELLKKEDFKKLLKDMAIACIGPVTTKTAKGWGMKVHIQPKEYTIPALTQAILDYFSPHPSPPVVGSFRLSPEGRGRGEGGKNGANSG
jgi:hydroxymethylbilane synthase